MSYDNQQPYSKKLLLNSCSEALLNKFILKRTNNKSKFNSFKLLNYKECFVNNEKLKMSKSTGSSFYKHKIKNVHIDHKSDRCLKRINNVMSPKGKIHFKELMYNGKVNEGVNIKKRIYVLLQRKYDDGKEK